MKPQILVPLDGSALAEMAVIDAIKLARATSASLVLMRVVPTPLAHSPLLWAGPPMETAWPIQECDATMAREYIGHLANRLEAEGVGVQTAVIEGDPASVIVAYAEQHPAVSTIVMSTHGRSGLNLLMFGSVAEKVLQASPVPLLLTRIREEAVTQNPQAHDFSRIVVPLDGSIFAEQALDHAQKLARSFNSTLVLVMAISEHNAITDAPTRAGKSVMWGEDAQSVSPYSVYLEQTARRLRLEGLSVITQTGYGAPADAILRATNGNTTDLIVMATHGRGGLQRLWLGSVALRVLRYAALPVLLVRVKERVSDREYEDVLADLAPSLSIV